MNQPITEQPVLNVSPLGDRIIVSPPDQSKKDKGERMIGDLVMPEGAKLSGISRWEEVRGMHHVTTALAVGPDCKHVKIGDTIVVSDRGLFYVNTGDVRFCACMEASVVGIVK